MDDLLERARSRRWYHTIELPGHTTRGMFDLRPMVHEYGLPERLDGLRCLDVGTWDGFWAFEMERRGAAEVLSLDLDREEELDWPPRRRPATFPDEPRGEGFRIASALLGSKVRRVVRSVYHATPEELGSFDVVFCGSVVIHLRDQLLAFERIAGLTKPGGLFVSAEEYDRLMDLVPVPAARYRADREKSVVFWQPSRKLWRRLLWTAGFEDVREHGRFDMRSTLGWGVRHVVHHARR